MGKRDIASAFMRVAVRPDSGRAFAHSFLGSDVGVRKKFSVGFLSTPHGFLDSPSYFSFDTTSIQSNHQFTKPQEGDWRGGANYSAFLYIGDGIFIERELASRPDDCVFLWAEIARNAIGKVCIDEEISPSEVHWAAEAPILSFALNTSTMEIRAPPAKVQEPADFILPDASDGCFKPLGVKSLQAIRGLMTHCLIDCLFRVVCLHPIGALFARANERGLAAHRANPELLKDFWAMFALIRKFSEDLELRPTVFKGDMRRILDVRKRFPSPQCRGDILRLTGDAALSTVSCINWDDRQFTKCDPETLLRGFSGPNASPPIVADIELISSVSGVVIWEEEDASTNKPNVAFVAAENKNAFAWLRRGKARVGRSRRVSTAFCLGACAVALKLSHFT